MEENLKVEFKENKSPYISVIITAYDRKKYLMNAIKSVLTQKIENSIYEIIVIKNFKDDLIDNFLKEKGIKNIINNNYTIIGEDLALGIEMSKGEIICFLDDDDMFSEEKLEFIYEIFHNHSDLIYFHNYQKYVDEKNTHVKPIYKPLKGIYKSEELIKNFKKIIHYGYYGPLFFNMSSISIRKNYFLDKLNILKLINYHPDDFFFFFSLDDQKNLLIFDDKPLTIYRIHESTSNLKISKSKQEILLKKEKIFNENIKTTALLIRNVKNDEVRKILSCRLNKEQGQLYLVHKSKKFRKENNLIKNTIKCVNFAKGNIIIRCFKLLINLFRLI